MQALPLLLAAILATASVAISQPAAGDQPRVEVCFVLDTTGSMTGLIDGAKQKIWGIANSIVQSRDKPEVRFALVGYRDRGDQYIVRRSELTDDIDTLFGELREYAAAGGGDGPESVNQALHEAITLTRWSDGESTTRIVFLVGDAPPHMDYPDDIPYRDSAKIAVDKQIILNTIQCGGIDATTSVWQEIAKLGGGEFLRLPQDGGMVAIKTPYDDKLAELQKQVDKTVLPYGNARQRKDVAEKQAAAATMPAEAQAARASYNVNTGKAVQGVGDLLADLDAGRISLDKLNEDELPEDLKKLSPEEQVALIEKQRGIRTRLQKELNELAIQRQKVIDAENQRLTLDGKSAFDAAVNEVIDKQLKASAK